MTKCTYDELAASETIADYHRALEQLFVSDVAEVSAPSPRRICRAAIPALAAIGRWRCWR